MLKARDMSSCTQHSIQTSTNYGESCELEQGKKVQVITVIIGEVQ